MHLFLEKFLCSQMPCAESRAMRFCSYKPFCPKNDVWYRGKMLTNELRVI